MMDLGKYANTVLSAYGVTITILVALVAVTLWRGAKTRRALEAQEARMGRTNNG
jgi:heme exporter protein D